MRLIKLSLQVGLVGITAMSVVQAANVPLKPLYSGSGEAGYSNSSGNTNSESIYAALKFKYQHQLYKAKGAFTANTKSESNIKTKERYVFDAQVDRFLSIKKKTYMFGQVHLVNDKFENTDLASEYVVGLGHQFFDTTQKTFSVEAGVGYQMMDYSVSSGMKDTEQAVFKLGADFKYRLNAQVQFLQNMTEFYSADVAKFEANTGVKVKLTDALKMKLTYQYRHNSNPTPGKKQVDTQTLITLLYDF